MRRMSVVSFGLIRGRVEKVLFVPVWACYLVLACWAKPHSFPNGLQRPRTNVILMPGGSSILAESLFSREAGDGETHHGAPLATISNIVGNAWSSLHTVRCPEAAADR